MTGIGSNVYIAGYITIKWNFVDIKVRWKKVQVNGYYMPVLGETQLMSPQAYCQDDHYNEHDVTNIQGC